MEIDQEKDIIELCKTDLSYFATIYDLYVKDVYRYSYSMVNDKSRAEDVTSETFLRALENINKYEFRGKTIKCWLFTIARNLVLKNINSECCSTTDSLEKIIDNNADETAVSILDRLINKEEYSQIEEAIANLNSEEKEIIRLKIWDEMTFGEIAIVLNTGISSVKMRFYRTLSKIKNYFIQAN